MSIFAKPNERDHDAYMAALRNLRHKWTSLTSEQTMECINALCTLFDLEWGDVFCDAVRDYMPLR